MKWRLIFYWERINKIPEINYLLILYLWEGIKTMKKRVFLLLIILFSFQSFAQEDQQKKILKEVGFWPGFGYGNSSKNLPEGNYQPFYFLFHIGLWPFSDNTFLKEHFQFYLEPQYNYVQLVSTSATVSEHEFGLNIGAKYIYPIYKQLDLFMYISTGPHSFSATTQRQAPGYLFSDNMGIGAYYHFTKKLAGVFTFRIRHMSNADTRQPNNGINTDNFHLGISRFF